MPRRSSTSTASPPRTLARLAASRGLTRSDVARVAGVTPAAVTFLFQREERVGITAEARAKYERAIDEAVAARDSLGASAAAWLRDQVRQGLLPKHPSPEQLRHVAIIVRSAVLAGPNGR